MRADGAPRPRSLILTSETPLPPTSGARLRTLHLARQLAAAMEVEVAAGGEVGGADREPFRLVGLGRPRSRWAAAARSAWQPYLAARMHLPDLAHYAAAGAWATVQAEFPFLVPAAAAAGAPVVLDAHNVETDLVASFGTSVPPLERLRWRWETAKTARFETNAVRTAAAVCSVSHEDAAALERMGARRLVVVPNGVDTSAIPFRAAPASEPVAAFVGNLGFRPNAAAADELAGEIWPRVRQAVPGARLDIVGRDPAPELRQRAGPGVKVVGEVAEVTPFLAAARVTVIPLRAGSGTRLKILEAMAAGVPVVSTALGAAGIEATHDEHLLIGDSPSVLADLTVKVLADDSLAARLAEAGRRLVEARYDWSVVARPLVELHLELAHPRAS